MEIISFSSTGMISLSSSLSLPSTWIRASRARNNRLRISSKSLTGDFTRGHIGPGRDNKVIRAPRETSVRLFPRQRGVHRRQRVNHSKLLRIIELQMPGPVTSRDGGFAFNAKRLDVSDTRIIRSELELRLQTRTRRRARARVDERRKRETVLFRFGASFWSRASTDWKKGFDQWDDNLIQRGLI